MEKKLVLSSLLEEHKTPIFEVHRQPITLFPPLLTSNSEEDEKVEFEALSENTAQSNVPRLSLYPRRNSSFSSLQHIQPLNVAPPQTPIEPATPSPKKQRSHRFLETLAKQPKSAEKELASRAARGLMWTKLSSFAKRMKREEEKREFAALGGLSPSNLGSPGVLSLSNYEVAEDELDEVPDEGSGLFLSRNSS